MYSFHFFSHTSSMILKLPKKFIICGIIGWCTEILFTSFQSFRRRDWKLKGQTSLWMFPIYGCGCLLAIPYRLLKNRPLWVRGLSYMTAIFGGEYLTGRLLWKYNAPLEEEL